MCFCAFSLAVACHLFNSYQVPSMVFTFWRNVACRFSCMIVCKSEGMNNTINTTTLETTTVNFQSRAGDEHLSYFDSTLSCLPNTTNTTRYPHEVISDFLDYGSMSFDSQVGRAPTRNSVNCNANFWSCDTKETDEDEWLNLLDNGFVESSIDTYADGETDSSSSISTLQTYSFWQSAWANSSESMHLHDDVSTKKYTQVDCSIRSKHIRMNEIVITLEIRLNLASARLRRIFPAVGIYPNRYILNTLSYSYNSVLCFMLNASQS